MFYDKIACHLDTSLRRKDTHTHTHMFTSMLRVVLETSTVNVGLHTDSFNNVKCH